MKKLYGMHESGNCWKASTMLDLTGYDFVWVHTDSNAGAAQTPAFRALNPVDYPTGRITALNRYC